MIHCLIVDDEHDCRSTLTRILTDRFKELNIVGEAKNIDEAERLIRDLVPELVFLDVEMPGGSGFDLLKRFRDPLFDVIFTTAYDSYALRAIKFNALDYLLKPFDILEIDQAVKKIVKKNDATSFGQLKQMIENLENFGSKRNRIALRTNESIEFLEVDLIVHCAAEGNYTRFFLTTNEEKLVVGKLKEFEEILADHKFIRVHNSHIVNVAMIWKFVKTEGGYFKMRNGKDIPISRRKKESVLNQLTRHP